ncbi:hypothetical protein [Aquimarina sp. AD1]|uniref:hypothetical protein n=1 Tax=Aquimarina sp. (strain AD1) TaxID=1714848 RepID=UPI000E4C40A9|nr:hypothetical protein [Aquimarina sp. AD1]AXT58012.1 hypothetical protein D1815_20465 [Aquimarina sp. AD1]RKN05617.1 hypothetical protein D7035_21310 [Aquimarina sp. AD1]
MEKFESLKIEKIGLSNIYGGLQYIDTVLGSGSSQLCDCLEDTNDNGKQDPGECAEIVVC